MAEPGVRASAGRLERLQAELERVAKFAGVEKVVYLEGGGANYSPSFLCLSQESSHRASAR